MIYPYCFYNGKISLFQKVSLKLNDLSILRGYGIFDYMRTYNGIPLFQNDYNRRFENSAKLMKLKIPLSSDEIKKNISLLLKKNKITEAGIRLVLTGGYSENMYNPTTSNFFILIENVQEVPRKTFNQGVKLFLFAHQREIPTAKTINYITAINISQSAVFKNFYDTLYHNKNNLLELTRSNFFIIKKNKLITPSENILHGITRKIVLEISQNIFDVEERNIKLSELSGADEAFLTATTKKILPVTQVGNYKIGNGKPGEKTILLNKMFDEYVGKKLMS